MTEVKGPKTTTSGEIDLSVTSGPSAAVGLEQESISSGDQKFIPVGHDDVIEVVAGIKADTQELPTAGGKVIRSGGVADDLRSDAEHSSAQPHSYVETALPLSQPLHAEGTTTGPITGVITGRDVRDVPERDEQSHEQELDTVQHLGRRMPAYRGGGTGVSSIMTFGSDGRFAGVDTGSDRVRDRLEDMEVEAA